MDIVIVLGNAGKHINIKDCIITLNWMSYNISHAIFINNKYLCSQIEVIFYFFVLELLMPEFINLVVNQDGKVLLVRNAHFYQVAQGTMVTAPNH